MADRKQRPWIAGIVDTLVGASILRSSQIPHRNRLAVILIDSAFETACRAYLQHEVKITLDASHDRRENLVKTVRAKLSAIDKDAWENINFYYSEIRNDFYHQSAGKTITEVAIIDYLDTVEFVVDTAFGIKINQLVKGELSTATAVVPTAELVQTPHAQSVPVRTLTLMIEKVIIGVVTTHPKRVDELNDFFKREGDSLRLSSDDFTNILARNSGSKKFFYFSKESKRWGLSSLGDFKLSQIIREGANG